MHAATELRDSRRTLHERPRGTTDWPTEGLLACSLSLPLSASLRQPRVSPSFSSLQSFGLKKRRSFVPTGRIDETARFCSGGMPSSVETAPPREDLPTLFCTECGGGIQQRWTFCAFCGHRCREDGRAVGQGSTDTKTNKGQPPGATADHLVDGYEGDRRGKSNVKLNDTDNSGVKESL